MTTRLLLLPLLLLVIAGCTTPQHEDSWRYEAAAATKAYGEYYLKEDWVLIESESIQAVRSAKQSADLMPLARFYLSRCALHRAVLLEDDCRDYLETAAVERYDELDAYYAMLEGNLTERRVWDLPYQYRDFARAVLKGDGARIRTAVAAVTPLQSQMVAASLGLEHLDEPLIEAIIDEASRLGYRRAVIAWMRYLEGVSADAAKREKLRNTLKLLEE